MMAGRNTSCIPYARTNNTHGDSVLYSVLCRTCHHYGLYRTAEVVLRSSLIEDSFGKGLVVLIPHNLDRFAIMSACEAASSHGAGLG